MQVIIPAAGYATRLYPLTKNRPKALLEVKGKPILEHIIARIEKLPNVKQITVVSNDKYYKNFKDWSEGFETSIPLKVLNDGTKSNEDRLGQIGDIQLAIEACKVEEDLLLISGDNLFNFQLGPIYDFFKEHKVIVNALYDIGSVEAAKELGVMAIDPKTKKVTDFEEKPAKPKSTSVSLGIYFFPRDKVKEIKAFLDKGGKPDKIGYLMAELTERRQLYGFVYKEKWFDIGVLPALEKARKEFRP
jgi:glucose-1-phosphate thymidylyltransferase